MSTKHRPRGLIGAIRRWFRTESHSIKGAAPRRRPRTQPSSWFLRAVARGEARWRTREQIGILRAPGKEVAEVTNELSLALMARCALIEPWNPDFPPPEVFVVLTRQGQEVLIERARRRARQRKAKR